MISLWLTKINNRLKFTSRGLIITNHRIIGIKKKFFGKIEQRRKTKLEDIKGIVVSKVSDEFVFIVPSEYDFHYTTGLSIFLYNFIRTKT